MSFKVEPEIERWVIDPFTQGVMAGVFSKVLSMVKVIGPAFSNSVSIGPFSMYPAIAVGVTSTAFNYIEKGIYIAINTYTTSPAMTYREQYAIDLIYVSLASIGVLGFSKRGFSNIGKINVLGSNAIAIYGKDLVMDLFLDRSYTSSSNPDSECKGKGYTLDDLGY
jgi:hypothetical protein